MPDGGAGEADAGGRRSLKTRVAELAEKTAASMKLEVVLVELKNEGGRQVLRVFLDQPSGISLDDCERFSKRFSVALDVEDFIPFAYVLEASSPGLNRPLVKERDFQRFAGEVARVRTRTPVEGQKNFKGRIVGADGGRVTIEEAPDKQVVIEVSDIDKAHLVADLTRGIHGGASQKPADTASPPPGKRSLPR
ncbi:MAG: ribosome maturation factor RimP [Acidobacteriota bacterium]|nr:ribosome maturation factor RimP [Acidobacteriota bacterium]